MPENHADQPQVIHKIAETTHGKLEILTVKNGDSFVTLDVNKNGRIDEGESFFLEPNGNTIEALSKFNEARREQIDAMLATKPNLAEAEKNLNDAKVIGKNLNSMIGDVIADGWISNSDAQEIADISKELLATINNKPSKTR